MDLGVKEFARQTRDNLKKFKVPLLVAALGVLILLLPVGRETAVEEPAIERAVAPDCEAVERRMAAILSQIDGAGEVGVMLTLRNDGRTEYQTDEQTTVREDATERRSETVFAGGAQGSALVSSVTTPEYRGAVVVCRGADDPQIRLDLVRAVSSLTGLTSDKITVLKMKG